MLMREMRDAVGEENVLAVEDEGVGQLREAVSASARQPAARRAPVVASLSPTRILWNPRLNVLDQGHALLDERSRLRPSLMSPAKTMAHRPRSPSRRRLALYLRRFLSYHFINMITV